MLRRISSIRHVPSLSSMASSFGPSSTASSPLAVSCGCSSCCFSTCASQDPRTPHARCRRHAAAAVTSPLSLYTTARHQSSSSFNNNNNNSVGGSSTSTVSAPKAQSAPESPATAASKKASGKARKVKAPLPAPVEVDLDNLEALTQSLALPLPDPTVEAQTEAAEPAKKKRKRRTKKEMAEARQAAAAAAAATEQAGKEEKEPVVAVAAAATTPAAVEGGEEEKLAAAPQEEEEAMATAATAAAAMTTAATPEAEPLVEHVLDNISEEDLFTEGFDDELSQRIALREGTLVYNALNGRMISEHAPSMRMMRELGFGVNKYNQLYVERPEVINRLASCIRTGVAEVPPKWPKKLTRTLGAILQNKSIEDPAAAVQQMIQIKINSITRSRYASVVNAAGEDGEEQIKDTLNLLDEATDPSKTIELNEEQEKVIAMALRGHHMYIGGSAGTGKTVLLRVLSRRLQQHRLRVAMTATTGVAGCHIGGSTFHHAMGVSAKGEFVRRGSILDYDVIIIDEVSMMPLRLFEDFDRVLREEAGTPDLPFGGVQIILCGDFMQLGCINEESILSSKLFLQNFLKLRLETIVRQSAYPKFAKDLQLMRLGLVPGDLMETVQQLPAGTMVESAVNLLPTNKEVHAANEKELARLEGDPLTLTPETGITSLKCEATATLLLRTAPNFNEKEFSAHIRSLLQATLELPRSSLLCLYRIYEDGHAMRVILPPGESVAWREAMRERFLEVASLINDLDLGAAVTEIVPNGDGLHTPESEEYLMKLMAKHPIAQPLTFKKGCRVLLRANLSSNLVNGSIGTVVDFVECKAENFPEFIRQESIDQCIERYRVFCFTECGMPIPMVPLVRFHTGETIAIPPWEFNVGGTPHTQYYSLSSVALPLSLAYAFTVHKVQGLTLVGRVHLELSRMWPCEHLLYVAMSRVRNPEQLSMSSFSPSMVVANPTCVAFDNDLRSATNMPESELAKYPICSWKRCNDTIYHLRRRGASLRQLLESATNGGVTQQQLQHAGGVNVGHLAAVEQSVIVARRMRKLIRHVDRVTRARNKAKAMAAAAAAATEEAKHSHGHRGSSDGDVVTAPAVAEEEEPKDQEFTF